MAPSEVSYVSIATAQWYKVTEKRKIHSAMLLLFFGLLIGGFFALTLPPKTHKSPQATYCVDLHIVWD